MPPMNDVFFKKWHKHISVKLFFRLRFCPTHGEEGHGQLEQLKTPDNWAISQLKSCSSTH